MSTISWKSAQDGEWYQNSSWDLNRDPQPGDDVVVGISGIYTVTIDPQTPNSSITLINVNSLTISDPEATVIANAALNGASSIHANITNQGTLIFDADTTLHGTLSNSGLIETGSIAIEQQVTNTGTMDFAGSISFVGNAPSDIFSAGTLDFSFSQVHFGTSGSLMSLGSGLFLTLDNTTVDAGKLDPINPFTTLSSNAGHLTLVDGTSLGNQALSFSNSGTYDAQKSTAVSTQHDFTNSGTLELDTGAGNGGSSLSVTGVLSNSGTLDIGNATLGSASTATVGQLQNTGSIALVGSASKLASLVDLGDAAPATLSGQSLSLSGDALLQYARGGISAIGASGSLSLHGTQAFIADRGHTGRSSALTGLDSNAGTLALSAGAALGNTALAFTNSGTFSASDHTLVKTKLDFTNGGQLNIDHGAGQSGSALNVTGTFANGGTFDYGNSGLTAADLSVVGTLHNTGTMDIAGGSATDTATLKVKGDATNTGTVEIDAFGSLTKHHDYTQTSGETDIAGALAASDVFVQGGVLQGTGSVAGSLAVSGSGAVGGGDFANATLGTLSIDGKLVDSGAVDATLVAEGSGSAGTIDVTGNKVSLKGGTLDVHVTDPANLHAGETFTILTFAAGALTYGFDHTTDGTHSGDGNSLDLENGFTLTVDYDNAAGTIALVVENTPEHAAEPVALEAHHPGLLHLDYSWGG